MWLENTCKFCQARMGNPVWQLQLGISWSSELRFSRKFPQIPPTGDQTTHLPPSPSQVGAGSGFPKVWGDTKNLPLPVLGSRFFCTTTSAPFSQINSDVYIWPCIYRCPNQFTTGLLAVFDRAPTPGEFHLYSSFLFKILSAWGSRMGTLSLVQVGYTN